MNYCNIIHDDFANNLDGIGVTLFVSGCDGHPRCMGCHNPDALDYDAGIPFDKAAHDELFNELSKDHISVLTLSGGDPLSPKNRETVLDICKEVKENYPDKKIWLYTGFLYDNVKDLEIIKYIDTIVDGPFIMAKRDDSCVIKGSRNQHVYDLVNGIIVNERN